MGGVYGHQQVHSNAQVDNATAEVDEIDRIDVEGSELVRASVRETHLDTDKYAVEEVSKSLFQNYRKYTINNIMLPT